MNRIQELELEKLNIILENKLKQKQVLEDKISILGDQWENLEKNISKLKKQIENFGKKIPKESKEEIKPKGTGLSQLTKTKIVKHNSFPE